MLRYLIPPNKTLIVRGPASFTLTRGRAKIFEAPLVQYTNMVVQRDKQLSIESEDVAEIELALSRTGEIMEMDGSCVPKSWRKLVDILTNIDKGIVMIIGPSDVGKSTLCTYVMNVLINRRRHVRVLDADIGQAEIGPPTTISTSTPTRPSPTLAHLEPERMYFVGHNTPSFVQSRVLEGIKRMLCPDFRGVTIVNTDGWVHDAAAIMYKRELISTVNPDKLVGIGPIDSFNSVVHTTKIHPLVVESPEVILIRTRRERKEIRRIGYQRFLARSTSYTLKLDNVKLKLRKSIMEAFSKRNINMSNVILGFLNDKGFLDQIGILESMTRSNLTVYSRRNHQPVIIEFGYVRLARDGTEQGYLD